MPRTQTANRTPSSGSTPYLTLVTLCLLTLPLLTSLGAPKTDPAKTLQDELAWQTLAQITGSTAISSTGETDVDWRRWLSSAQLYNPGYPQPSFENDCKAPSSVTVRKSSDLCQAVYLSGEASNYVGETNHLNCGSSTVCQHAFFNFAKTEGVSFPSGTKEIKTEWIQISSKSASEYIVARKGSATFGLIALHLKAKVLKDSGWLWATWIHRKEMPSGTPTHDSFGADQQGGISDALRNILESKSLQKLETYALIGTQTAANLETDPVLANPIIEGANHVHDASCVGCHQYARITAADGYFIAPDPAKKLLAPMPTSFSQNSISIDQDFTLIKGTRCANAEKNCIQ